MAVSARLLNEIGRAAADKEAIQWSSTGLVSLP